MRKSCVSWLVILVMALSIAACGGGGSNPAPATDTTQTTTPTDTTTTTTTTTPTPTPPSTTAPITPSPPSVTTNPAVVVKTGIFVDAPVEGLSFVSGGQTGVTDASGTFRFEAGANVKFMIGNVVIGQAPATALMTPLDLVKNVDAAATISDARVIQITQFLMTVDSSATLAKMTIPASVVAAASNETAVDLSQAPVDIAPILTRLTTHTLVTVAAATAHLQGATTAFTAAQITGTFAGLDSTAAPKLGLMLSMKPNLAGDAFDVTGTAAQIAGATWSIAGTMTTGGVLTATGTGTGASPPANMTITGAMTAVGQITASASLSPTALPVPILLDKAVAQTATGKFALPADAGVATVAGDLVHVGADINILADGSVSAHVVRGQITGVVALLQVYSTHFAGLNGIVTANGNIVAFGGLPDAGDAFNLNGKVTTVVSPVTFFIGSFNAVAGTAAIKMTANDLNAFTPAVTTLSFVKAANAFVGVFQGTHTDTAPGLPSTFTFGVNNDNSAHGFAMFLIDKGPPKGILQTPFLLEGTVNPATGALAPPPAPFNIGALGTAAAFPGLVMFDNEAAINLTPGTFAGTIAAGAVSGTWQTGPGVLLTGTFTGPMLP